MPYHFKAHELTGIGGAIKNVGMGLAARSGKLAIHSTVTPYMDKDCEACGQCIVYCPGEAITLSGPGGKPKSRPGNAWAAASVLSVAPAIMWHIRWDENGAECAGEDMRGGLRPAGEIENACNLCEFCQQRYAGMRLL